MHVKFTVDTVNGIKEKCVEAENTPERNSFLQSNSPKKGGKNVNEGFNLLIKYTV